jgi:hypothetical protein
MVCQATTVGLLPPAAPSALKDNQRHEIPPKVQDPVAPRTRDPTKNSRSHQKYGTLLQKYRILLHQGNPAPYGKTTQLLYTKVAPH